MCMLGISASKWTDRIAMDSSPNGVKQTGNNTTGLLEDEDKCEDEHDAAQSTNMKNGNNGENIEYQSKSLYLSVYKKGITAV